MNILLFTPFYKIINRRDLKEDTLAVHYFTREWVKMGHNVVVVHFYHHSIKNIIKNSFKKYDANKKTQVNEFEGVKVVLIETQLLIPKKQIYNKYQIKNKQRMIKTVLEELNFKPDILVSHSPSHYIDIFSNYFMDKYKKIAILHNFDIKYLEKNKQHLYKLMHIFENFAFRSKIIRSKFTELSQETQKDLLVFSGAPVESNILPNNVDLNRSKLKIIYVGRLIELKNIDITIKALNKIKDSIKFEFTIVGDGKELNNIKQIISKYKLNDYIKLVGHKSRNEVLELMKENDIFIMVSKPETFGIVYLEAMMMGCIPIGSRGEGIDGVIEDGKNGFLCEPKNIEMLAKLLLSINKLTEQQIIQIRKNAFMTASEMSEFNVAKRYIGFLQEIIDE